MKPSSPTSGTARRGGAPVRAAAVGVAVGGLVLAVGMGTALSAPTTRVPLGTSASFVVLAGSGITNTGATTLGGDLGTFPTTAVTNTGSFTFTNGGVNHGGDGVTQGAKDDLNAAYSAAQSASPRTTVAGGTLGGRTLTPGVYSSASSLDLTGTLTLDGAGGEDAVFIFQAGSTLTTASASRVLLQNGATACNVFWQVGSSATLGTDSRLVGSVLAETSITATSRAAVQGRLLAKGGAVTLDNNTISRPVCQAAAAPSPSPSTTTSPTTTASPTPTPTDSTTATPTATTSPTPTATATPAPTTPAPATPPDQTVTTTGTTTGLTTTGLTTTGTPSTTTSGGITGGQITRVPRGSVPAGDGSAAGQAGGSSAWAGALGLLMLTATVAVAARRRHQDA